MKTLIGQDALGRWAWMIVDDRGRLLASDDDYYEATLATEAALERMKKPSRELEPVG